MPSVIYPEDPIDFPLSACCKVCMEIPGECRCKPIKLDDLAQQESVRRGIEWVTAKGIRVVSTTVGEAWAKKITSPINRVLTAFAALGEAIDETIIAVLPDLTPENVRSCRAKLMARGRLRFTGKRKPTSRGRKAKVYEYIKRTTERTG